MARDHGDLHDEPHFRAGSPRRMEDGDRLDEEPVRASEVVDDDREGDYAVSDEPALGWSPVDRARTPGYADRVAARRAATPVWQRWVVIVLAGLVAGPFAVFGAFFKAMLGEGGFGYMAVTVFGPVIEEMLKVACVLWLVERRPWVIPSAGAIVLAGVLGGAGFASIENWFYLFVYFPDHSPALVQWRWTVGVALHTGCSLIAAWGIAKMWVHSMAAGRPADLSIAFPWLVTAIVIHGVYNAFAVLLHLTGTGPQ